MHTTDFDKRFKRMRLFATIWVVFVLTLVVALFAAAGYTLFHPELIGQFFGRIVAGFNGAA